MPEIAWRYDDLRLNLPDQPMIINGRYSEICQVFLNLFKNASDAMRPMDNNWLLVQGFLGDKYVELRVTNSGPTIDPKDRPYIFKRFYTTKGEGQGTGLGLPISLKIVKEHKGSFYLDENAENTTFIVRLPLSFKKEFASGSSVKH